ncbi:HPr family phosphocarrier protein [Fredinandcohnia sp. 179-A 10B2 NHS]|uniref:HPr family phosphocarrier protein n=1 Tax=Fredinandcohnia sp. 179-A 10B2 NHS TaxID=3235176 RepID=UPI0039A1BD73
MIEKEITVTLKDGLHARPAAELVKNLSRYTSDVEININNRSYNAKSILGLMSAGIKEGQKLTFKVNGEDEQEVVSWLESFI